MEKKIKKQLITANTQALKQAKKDLKTAVDSKYLFYGIVFGVLGNLIAEIIFNEFLIKVSNITRYIFELAIILCFIYIFLRLIKNFEGKKQILKKINKLIELKEKNKSLK